MARAVVEIRHVELLGLVVDKISLLLQQSEDFRLGQVRVSDLIVLVEQCQQLPDVVQIVLRDLRETKLIEVAEGDGRKGEVGRRHPRQVWWRGGTRSSSTLCPGTQTSGDPKSPWRTASIRSDGTSCGHRRKCGSCHVVWRSWRKLAGWTASRFQCCLRSLPSWLSLVSSETNGRKCATRQV